MLAGKEGCNRTEQQGLTVKAQKHPERKPLGRVEAGRLCAPHLGLPPGLQDNHPDGDKLAPFVPPMEKLGPEPSRRRCVVSFQPGVQEFRRQHPFMKTPVLSAMMVERGRGCNRSELP